MQITFRQLLRAVARARELDDEVERLRIATQNDRYDGTPQKQDEAAAITRSAEARLNNEIDWTEL